MQINFISDLKEFIFSVDLKIRTDNYNILRNVLDIVGNVQMMRVQGLRVSRCWLSEKP